jgi:3-oxoacyl-[acyl-carrier-protein] synthase-1
VNVYLSPPGLVCCAGQNREELYRAALAGYRGGFISKASSVPQRPGESRRDGPALPGQNASPDGDGFPAGLVFLPAAGHGAAGGGRGKIFRLLDAALEQIRIYVEAAVEQYGPERIGVCLGSCDNGSEASLDAHRIFIQTGKFPSDYSLRFQGAALPAEYTAGKFGLSGPVLTTATACASGASAIVRAAELIRSGICGAVVAGGVDIVSDTVFLGFRSLEALSPGLANPFSKNRDGINLGEGAAFFLLNSEDFGIELLGAGESADGYHMTAPGKDGAGAAAAMKKALFNAELTPEAIGYVNLHGTGTALNDIAEAIAMKTVFGENIPPASSTKPVTGHTLGAAGAIEAALCWMTLNGGGIPVHCWDGERDGDMPVIPLAVPGERLRPGSACMTNSFAFGGCNVSLVLGRSSR